MNKYDQMIKSALNGLQINEATTLSMGMMKALGKTMRLKRVCDKCGFMMPKYTGRYPKYCPMCADPVTDVDKEVIVDEVEYSTGEQHTHATQHGDLAHNQSHLKGPVNEEVEDLDEAASKWVAKPGMLFRPSGKTYPLIMITDNGKLSGRDNNGPRPSKGAVSDDVSKAGLQSILQQEISQPWPSEQDIEIFFSEQ